MIKKEVNMEIYLDNSATTRVRPEVLQGIIDTNQNNYANPSSLHRMGLKIEKKIRESRSLSAKLINAKADEIYFTGGGTESNNIAIIGQLNKDLRGKNIITTVIEHPSVYNVYRHFRDNVQLRYLDTDSRGKIDLNQLENMADENTLLLSIMLVNSEIGIIQDLSKIIDIAKKKNKKIKIHVDAIQAYGKIKIDVKKTDIDTLSFSSHKIHGPKGVGGLYIRKGCNVDSNIFGGNQERGIRSGTENTPGIVGFGIACGLVNNNFQKENNKLRDLRDIYAKRLIEEIDDLKINSQLNEDGAPHILNVSFKDVRGEILVHYLEESGIYVSTGSACSSKAKVDSRVLDAIKLDKDYLDGTIRLSLGYFNTCDEVEYVVEKIKESVAEMRNIMKIRN
jgi:cysteine desulfurase